MKKLLFGILGLLIISIAVHQIYWNLPVRINRRSDIALGEKIIKRIDSYKLKNGLPENHDWETLKKFPFYDNGNFLEPDYKKLDSDSYELTFIEGFDGPYLTWNSDEKEWKISF